MNAGLRLKPATKSILHKLDADLQGTQQVYQACVKRTYSVTQIEGISYIFSCRTNSVIQVRIRVKLFTLAQH
jgi:hypothetical protein